MYGDTKIQLNVTYPLPEKDRETGFFEPAVYSAAESIMTFKEEKLWPPCYPIYNDYLFVCRTNTKK
jgi:hypothetical protein